MTPDYPTSESAFSAPPLLRPGSVIRDVYRIEERLGAGAHGTVYRVHHRFLGVQALKLLHAGRESDMDQVLREAQILIGVTHPRIVRVFDAGVVDLSERAFPFLTMEYLPFGTLADVLERRLRLDIPDALDVAIQILDGLAAVHDLVPPVLHRDLIPSNVLIVGDDPLRVKIGDFGVAGIAHPVSGTTRPAGLINYLPPEATWGYATTSGDLYAVALMLYAMVSGTAAFPIGHVDEHNGANDRLEVMLAPRRQPPLRPSRFRPEISPALDGLLMKALSPGPDQRFGSAQELSNAIRAILEFEVNSDSKSH